MSCNACDEAAANPLTGSYHANCIDCSARALAHSPLAFHAVRGQPHPLRDAIAKLFGADRINEGRLAVWNWMQRIKSAKETKHADSLANAVADDCRNACVANDQRGEP